MGIETGLAVLIVGGLMAAGTAYSAHEERRSAEAAADAQRDVANAQIQAQKDQEILAQETATKKTKLAQAKKSKTILTSPTELDSVDANKQSAMGV